MKIKKILQEFLNTFGYTIVGHSDKRLLKQVMKVREEVDMRISVDEAIQLYKCVEATNYLPGDIAEVGTYEGASSKLICLAKRTSKKAYFFDTFDGLPELTPVKDPNYTKGEFKTSYDKFKEYLSVFPNVQAIKGFFPKTGSIIKNKKFALVNLDVDIWQSTLDSLKFFYPRMVKGGIILIHDYAEKKGVWSATNDFLYDKKDILIPLIGSYAMIVKS